jgi:hypothetical protein
LVVACGCHQDYEGNGCQEDEEGDADELEGVDAKEEEGDGVN